jgi:uncharacterized membrane protein YgaE (UPF0421/DUF939 family)
MQKQLRAMLAAQAIGAAIAIPFFLFIGYKLFSAAF